MKNQIEELGLRGHKTSEHRSGRRFYHSNQSVSRRKSVWGMVAKTKTLMEHRLGEIATHKVAQRTVFHGSSELSLEIFELVRKVWGKPEFPQLGG